MSTFCGLRAEGTTCGGMGFTVSLSQLLQVGIGGWLKLQMGLADMLDRNPGMRHVRIRRKMKFVNNSVHFDSED